jgi:putative polyhydroxyalkanoate system protein
MSKISVRQPHSVGRAQARDKLGGFTEMLSKYGVKLKWAGDQATIKGMGVSGQLAVNDADVQVDLKLGMMARAAGVDPKRLEASIAKRLSSAFTDE